MPIKNYRNADLYKLPEVEQFAEDRLNAGDGYRTVCSKIKDKFGVEFNHNTIKNYFDAKSKSLERTGVINVDQQLKTMNEMLWELVNMDKMYPVKCPNCHEKFSIPLKNTKDNLKFLKELRRQLDLAAGVQSSRPITKKEKTDPISKAQELRRIVEEEMDFEKSKEIKEKLKGLEKIGRKK